MGSVMITLLVIGISTLFTYLVRE